MAYSDKLTKMMNDIAKGGSKPTEVGKAFGKLGKKNPSSLAKRVADKVVDVTSDILSAPSVLNSKIKQARAESDTRILKQAKEYKGAPDFADGAPTEAFKARFMADRVKEKYAKKKK